MGSDNRRQEDFPEIEDYLKVSEVFFLLCARLTRVEVPENAGRGTKVILIFSRIRRT